MDRTCDAHVMYIQRTFSKRTMYRFSHDAASRICPAWGICPQISSTPMTDSTENFLGKTRYTDAYTSVRSHPWSLGTVDRSIASDPPWTENGPPWTSTEHGPAWTEPGPVWTERGPSVDLAWT